MRRKHDVCCQLRGVAQTPADQEPPAPVRLPRRGQREPPPVIPARAFGTVASTQPAPPLSPQRRQDGFDLLLPASTPDIFFPRDGQDMGVLMFLQPHPQLPIITIDAIPRPPGGWDPRAEGAPAHLLRQLRCGRKGMLRWHPGPRAAALVVGPFLGHIEVTIKQDVPPGTRIGQEHPNLTILNAPRCAAILARHPSRPLAFFEKPRLIDDQHGLRGPQMLDHVGAQIVAEGISLPYRSSQYMLDPIRGGLAVDRKSVV